MINAEERISRLEKQVRRLINQICCADEPIALAWGGITGDINNQTDLNDELSTLEGNISGLQTDLGTTQGQVVDLGIDVDNVEADIVTINGTLATKENALTFTTPYFSRVGDTISLANAAADGTTKGIAAFTAADFNATAGVISIDYANGQAASASVNGFMTTGTQSFAGTKTFNGAVVFGTTGSNANLSFRRTSDGVQVASLVVSTSPVFNTDTGVFDINAGGATRIRVGTNGIFVGGAATATARLELLAGTAGANTAPLKFNSGTNLTTAVAGTMEYNGTNLFFTRVGTTRESVLTGNSGAAAPTTTAGGTITNRYGGDTNFLGDPNSWASVVIGGTTYKIPLYT